MDFNQWNRVIYSQLKKQSVSRFDRLLSKLQSSLQQRKVSLRISINFNFVIVMSVMTPQMVLGFPKENSSDILATISKLGQQISKTYGNIAEQVSDDCPAYGRNELISYISTFKGTAFHIPNDYRALDLKELTELAESLFFKNALMVYLDEARCAYKKVSSSVSANDEIIEALAKDLAPKIIYLRALEKDISFIEGRALFTKFRNSTENPYEIEMRVRYDVKLKERHDFLIKEWKLIYFTIWQIRTLHMSAYIRELIDSDYPEPELVQVMTEKRIKVQPLLNILQSGIKAHELADFGKRKIQSIISHFRPPPMREVLEEINGEIKNDFAQFSEKSRKTFSNKNNGQILELGRSLESFLVQSDLSWVRNHFNSEVTRFNPEVFAEGHFYFKQKLHCNLNNRYQVGPERIENGLFVATVVLTLGESLLVNMGKLFRMGATAARIERIAKTAAVTGESFEAAEILNKIALKCLADEPSFLENERACSPNLNEKDLNFLILKEVQQKNCVYSLVSNITKVAGKIYHGLHFDFDEEQSATTINQQE
jgi:hypothetical protein